MASTKLIYFACSIRGGRDDADIYAALVEHLKGKAVVLSEIFADGTLSASGSPGSSQEIYEKDMAWVRQADALIAEVTNPSLGVGYEIGQAEVMNKPILALFRDDGTRKLSAMIDGSPHVRVITYHEVRDAERAIDEFMYSID